MKGQGGLESIYSIIIIIILASVFIPIIYKISSDTSEVPKLREQLQTCQNSLSSLQNQLINITECQNNLNSVRDQLNKCNESLNNCLKNSSLLADEVNRLSNCCSDSTKCQEDLNRCLQFNRTITVVNVQDYTIIFPDVKVNISYFLMLFIAIPTIDLITIPLLDFSLVTLEVKFRRKKTEKVVFFIKIIPKILALGVVVSFFLQLPLYPTLVVSFVLGLYACHKIFEISYRRKWHLFELFKVEIDKILELNKNKEDGS